MLFGFVCIVYAPFKMKSHPLLFSGQGICDLIAKVTPMGHSICWFFPSPKNLKPIQIVETR
uniref:Uncharacterized protein n=1 Tax=Anguilla anguilla TaxID=7936 RepID=A0A0E9TIL9_ANGAN